jgi:hypothetical protein
LQEISSKRRVINGTLNKYLGKDGKVEVGRISRADRDGIITTNKEILERTYNLAKWGLDAHVAVAAGFQVYWYFATLIADDNSNPPYARQEVVGLIRQCEAGLRVHLPVLRAAETRAIEELNGIPRKYWLTDYPRQAPTRGIFLLDLVGSFRDDQWNRSQIREVMPPAPDDYQYVHNVRLFHDFH